MKCAIIGCNNSSHLQNEFVSFHSLPTDAALQKKWLNSIGLPSGSFRPKAVICSDHFETIDIVRVGKKNFLSSHAVPKLHLTPSYAFITKNLKFPNSAIQKRTAECKKPKKPNRPSIETELLDCVSSTPITHIQAIKTGVRGIGVMEFVSTISRSTQTSADDLTKPVAQKLNNTAPNTSDVQRNTVLSYDDEITPEALQKLEEEVDVLTKIYLSKQKDIRKVRQQKMRRVSKIQSLKESLLSMKTPLGVPLTIVLEDSDDSPGEDHYDLEDSDTETADKQNTISEVNDTHTTIVNATENSNASILPVTIDNQNFQILYQGALIHSGIVASDQVYEVNPQTTGSM